MWRTWTTWTTRTTATTTISNMTILICVTSKITLVGSGTITRCAFITTQNIREIGGGVVLVNSIGIDTPVTFVKICRGQGVTVLVNRAIDGKSIKGDSDQVRRRTWGNANQTAGWLFVVVVGSSIVRMTVAHVEPFCCVSFYGIIGLGGPRVIDDKAVGGHGDRSSRNTRWLSCYGGVPVNNS